MRMNPIELAGVDNGIAAVDIFSKQAGEPASPIASISSMVQIRLDLAMLPTNSAVKKFSMRLS